MNPDEEENYQIAYNHFSGNGYTDYNIESKKYVPTAFHSSFSVFVYEFLIKHSIKKNNYVMLTIIVSQLLYAFSVYYFYMLCNYFFNKEKYSFYTTITYAFYPSIFYYIGCLNWYENFVVYLSVIIIYKLIAAFYKGFSWFDYLTIPVGIAISCLFRPNVIAVYSMLFSIYFILIAVKKKWSLLPLIVITIFFTFLMHLPALNKN